MVVAAAMAAEMAVVVAEMAMAAVDITVMARWGRWLRSCRPSSLTDLYLMLEYVVFQ